MVGRSLILAYGLLCYALFLGAFLYCIGFVHDFGVPKSIDSGVSGPWGVAMAINVALLSLFAGQHTIMARPAFKRWWTRIVPPAAERSTFVLATVAVLVLMFWQWRPMGGVLWNIENPVGRWALLALAGLGWATVLISTFLINHFDLFGLRQVWLHFRGRDYTHLHFVTPGPYRFIRHPLYIGFMLAFWATPTMTVGHWLFAVMTTGYMLFGIQLEERDLVRFHPDYEEYRKQVPMLIPRPAARWRGGSDEPIRPEPEVG